MMMMAQQRLRVRLMRGGTSKGVFLMDSDLPPFGSSERDAMLLRLLGSPDPSKMQLDGLGGGISSTSKVAIMKRRGQFAEYLFGQVSLDTPIVDWEGNCGNLASAAGLFAIERELFTLGELKRSNVSDAHRVVPIWQANSGYEMRVHVPVGQVSTDDWIETSGVPGKAPPILIEVVDPCAGRKTELFPTGSPSDTLRLSCGRAITATLLFGANPTVIVHAKDLGLKGTELPVDLRSESLNNEIAYLQRQGAEAMNLDSKNMALRVCWVAAPHAYITTDGRTISENDVDILSRITTQARVHHAHTATGAMNVAIASAIPGTVPHEITGGKYRINLGHPAGLLMAMSDVQGYHVNLQVSFELLAP